MGQKSGITYSRLFSPATLVHHRQKRTRERTPPSAVRAPKATRREGPTRTRRARPLNIPRKSDRPSCARTARSIAARDTHTWVISARGGFRVADPTAPREGTSEGLVVCRETCKLQALAVNAVDAHGIGSLLAAQIHLKLHLRNGLSKMGDQGARIINVPVEFLLQTDQSIRIHLGCFACLPLTVEALPLSIGERVSLARPAPEWLSREGVEGLGIAGILGHLRISVTVTNIRIIGPAGPKARIFRYGNENPGGIA